MIFVSLLISFEPFWIHILVFHTAHVTCSVTSRDDVSASVTSWWWRVSVVSYHVMTCRRLSRRGDDVRVSVELKRQVLWTTVTVDLHWAAIGASRLCWRGHGYVCLRLYVGCNALLKLVVISCIARVVRCEQPLCRSNRCGLVSSRWNSYGTLLQLPAVANRL